MLTEASEGCMKARLWLAGLVEGWSTLMPGLDKCIWGLIGLHKG